IIRHVEAPGVFNEEAFKTIDKVMQIANEVGVRIIIPFVDNWWWWGGPEEYAAFRNKSRDEFWTDPQLISDFERTIEFLVLRKNTYTGQLYKDDKALFGWETGNELVCPYSWTKQIAAFIKSLDPNHVVIEGTHAQILTENSIADPNIDVLTTHHYTNLDETIKNILKNEQLAKDKKPYYIGEFGLKSPEDLKTIVDTVINSNLSGIMLWSLRSHNRDGGFYMHLEKNGFGSYRFPGFASGDSYNEKEMIDFMREKAYEIDGKTAPPLEIPASPKLLGIKDIYHISWQGSVGASSYVIERRESGNDTWSVITDSVTDADIAYKPLFIDTTAVLGHKYFYRIIAKNESGVSDPSNEVGPVKVNFLKIVDELADDSKIFKKNGVIEPILFKEIYQVKEDDTRLEAESGASVIYKVPESISSFLVDVFMRNNVCGISLLAADSLDNFTPLAAKIESFPPRKNVYGFLTPVKYSCDEFPYGTRYVKILCNDEAQLSRVEIEYTKK
ncbi:MAG: cellulase family glycosylhydrolase, partial [Ignavibacteriaceae bacterium]